MKPNSPLDVRFGLYELRRMKIKAFRRDVLDISQEQFAQRLGLKSKSHMSEIEAKNRCSPEIALKIEDLSEGRVTAESICPAVALVRQQTAA